MKDYVVVSPFQDKTQKHRHYRVGDAYPYGNWRPSQERIDELLYNEEYGRAFIEEVSEEREYSEEE
ncbi:hypothetical protein ACFFGV_19570 [Pontibacillus salicampi]|uniref:Uncharacterized protein n=1 Tax=Pontibacillus salicampi TaxID=1449801 RepID=A0ABV6LTN2_9BACI